MGLSNVGPAPVSVGPATPVPFGYTLLKHRRAILAGALLLVHELTPATAWCLVLTHTLLAPPVPVLPTHATPTVTTSPGRYALADEQHCVPHDVVGTTAWTACVDIRTYPHTYQDIDDIYTFAWRNAYLPTDATWLFGWDNTTGFFFTGWWADTPLPYTHIVFFFGQLAYPIPRVRRLRTDGRPHTFTYLDGPGRGIHGLWTEPSLARLRCLPYLPGYYPHHHRPQFTLRGWTHSPFFFGTLPLPPARPNRRYAFRHAVAVLRRTDGRYNDAFPDSLHFGLLDRTVRLPSTWVPHAFGAFDTFTPTHNVRVWTVGRSGH